jgi:DNA replication factor GINS
MNLNELQSVQARERQSSDLQHLQSSFYREVGEFIQGLTDQRAQAVERADDPFSSPEVRRLSDDIETAEQTVEAIYERRVGKVVKKASIAAAGMPVDDEGLTEEEEALFDDLVSRIETNRETVLSVLDGDAPSVSCSIDEDSGAREDDASASPSPDRAPTETAAGSEPPPGSEPEGVSAADLMGSGPAPGAADPPASESGSDPDPESRGSPGEDPVTADPETDGTAESSRPDPSEESSGDDPDAEPSPDGESPGSAGGRDVPNLPRTTVRITADVGEVVGADDRDYDLGPEDVVTLPEPNADVLVEKDAAERLE